MKDKIDEKVREVKDVRDVKEPITLDFENKRISIFYFMPLLLIAGFVPLIVYAKFIDLSGTTQALYWTGQHQYLDFFSYWKSKWVIALTVIALIYYIILYKQKKLPFKDLKHYYIPLGIYAIFVIISTVFAIDTQTALWGFVDMYQGMFVLLSYVLITFLTINFVNNERDVILFVKAFLFLMIFEGVIGVGQYFGFDIFQTKIGNDLILPSNLKVDNLSFSFGPKTIYGTLFNTNFVGSFATLMLPLSVAFLLGAKTKKQRIISAIATILMIFVWIGCNSRAGYLGIAVAFVFALWLFRKVIRKYWVGFVGLVVAFTILLVGLNHVSDGRIFEEINSFNINKEIERLKSVNENKLKFNNIILGKDTFLIETYREVLNGKLDGEKLYFLDENMKELEFTIRNKKIMLKNERYRPYTIKIAENYPGVTISRLGINFDFYFTSDGVKVITAGGRLADHIVADRLETLDGLEHFASGRGYIWSRTIPLLLDNVIGYGPDNYPLIFPQDDFVAKFNAGMSPFTVVDKPHDLYLQIATNTSVISLISLLIFWGIYIISSLRLYSKVMYDTLDKYVGASCLIGVIGYLSAGIFNDSVISVAPLFWIMLGLGISINFRLKNKMI